MDKSKRMAPVVRVTESREEKAAREYGECQRALADQQKQLTMLRAYRQEYERQLQERGEAGVTVSVVLETRRFLAQLDKAIGQQQALVDQTARVCQQKRAAWMNARTRSEAVNKVVERMASDEQRRDDQRAQKESDDLSQRKRRDEGE
jgi:flagellar FliJ protein